MSVDIVFDTLATSSFGIGDFILTASSAYVSLSFGATTNKTFFQNQSIASGSLQLVAFSKFATTNVVSYSLNLQLRAYDKFSVPSVYLPSNMILSANNNAASSSIQLVTYPNNPLLFILD